MEIQAGMRQDLEEDILNREHDGYMEPEGMNAGEYNYMEECTWWIIKETPVGSDHTVNASDGVMNEDDGELLHYAFQVKT